MNASKNLDEMRDIAARICRDYLTGAWKMITADDIQLKRISGGLSNFLYHVSLPDNVDNNNERTTAKRLRKEAASRHLSSEPKEVLLRIYGQMHGEQAMETVLTDTVVFTLLSERKLGPKLHGIFPGGRIEQYIPARPLTTLELSEPRISAKIAEKMAAIHGLNIPVSKEPEWLWKTMARWLLNSESVLATYKSSCPHETALCDEMRTFDYRSEMMWLKQTIEAEDYPVVFSHNDMQEGNILFREDSPNTAVANAASVHNNTSSSASAAAAATNGECSPMERIQFDSDADDGDSNTATANQEQQQQQRKPKQPSSQLDTSNCESSDGTTSMDDDLNRSCVDANDVCDDDVLLPRKRTFSLDTDDIDTDNTTRDSVLSNGSQTYCDGLDEPALMIIDFEYCAYNYRGFDLANHFVEWTIDYTNKEFPFYHHRVEQYPNREQQQHFIEAYLKAMAVNADGLSDSENYNAADKEITDLLDEVRCFRMASHLFYTLWAIVNVHQEIEFGYWDYGLCRLKEYLAAKEEYTKCKGLGLKRKHTLDKRQ